MSKDTFKKALGAVEVNPGFPGSQVLHGARTPKSLLNEKKIARIPDWSKALRPDFIAKARTGA